MACSASNSPSSSPTRSSWGCSDRQWTWSTASSPASRQIKRFRVLPEMLSVEGGGLTPTLKVKRRVVCERYAELVESMYEE